MDIAAPKAQVILLIDLGRYFMVLEYRKETLYSAEKSVCLFFLKDEYHYPSKLIPWFNLFGF